MDSFEPDFPDPHYDSNELQLYVARSVQQINNKLDGLMSTVDDMSGQLDTVQAQNTALSDSLTNIMGDVNSLKAEIDALKAGGQGATQEQLDALSAKIATVVETATANAQAAADLAASTPESPPNP